MRLLATPPSQRPFERSHTDSLTPPQSVLIERRVERVTVLLAAGVFLLDAATDARRFPLATTTAAG